MALSRGDQVAAAVRAGLPVGVVLFQVLADLMKIIKDLATWSEKHIFGYHLLRPSEIPHSWSKYEPISSMEILNQYV